MAEIHLVCEGDPGALDERILQHALVNKLGVDVQLHPTGGESSVPTARAFLEGMLARRGQAAVRSVRAPPPRVYSVQDRNYRAAAAGETVITADPAERSFVWARHEIENYLFEPAILLRMFQSWVEGWQGSNSALPQDAEGVEKLLVELRAILRVRHAGEIIRRKIRPLGHRLEGSTNSRGKSSRRVNLPALAVPDEQERWIALLDALLVQERERIKTTHEYIDQLDVTRELERALRDVDSHEFVERRRHIDDLGGHELVAALWCWLFTRGVKRLPVGQLRLEVLEDQLVAAFEAAYEPDRTYSPDEFALLAVRLRRPS